MQVTYFVCFEYREDHMIDGSHTVKKDAIIDISYKVDDEWSFESLKLDIINKYKLKNKIVITSLTCLNVIESISV